MRKLSYVVVDEKGNTYGYFQTNDEAESFRSFLFTECGFESLIIWCIFQNQDNNKLSYQAIRGEIKINQ